MARSRSKDGPNRSAFIREKLAADPSAKVKQINAAWKEAGNLGEISNTLYYQVKGTLGIRGTGRGRGRPPGSGAAASATGAAAPARRGRPPRVQESSGDANGSYLSIEESLDKLISQAQELRDSSLVSDLKAARRRVSVKLV